jgi:hypothetical protein
VLVVSKGAVKKTLLNAGFIVHELMWFRIPGQARPELDVTSGKGTSLPHGAVIAAATVSYLVVEALWAPR